MERCRERLHVRCNAEHRAWYTQDLRNRQNETTRQTAEGLRVGMTATGESTFNALAATMP